MNKKTKRVFLFFTALVFVFLGQIGYLYATKSITPELREKKQLFVSLTLLPDLALSTEADYIRHRSLSAFFSLFKEGPLLREYFVSTHLYAPSKNYFTASSDEK
jgi:hypothetical protein